MSTFLMGLGVLFFSLVLRISWGEITWKREAALLRARLEADPEQFITAFGEALGEGLREQARDPDLVKAALEEYRHRMAMRGIPGDVIARIIARARAYERSQGAGGA